MPLQTYWKINDLLKKADLLSSEKEPQADIQEVYKAVYKTAIPYTIYESDRMWLISQYG